MKRVRGAVFGALAMATLCAGWAVLAWTTGLGGEICVGVAPDRELQAA